MNLSKKLFLFCTVFYAGLTSYAQLTIPTGTTNLNLDNKTTNVNFGFTTGTAFKQLALNSLDNSPTLLINNLNSLGSALQIKAGNGSKASSAYSLLSIVDVNNTFKFNIDGKTGSTLFQGYAPEIILDDNFIEPGGTMKTQFRLSCTNGSGRIHSNDNIFTFIDADNNSASERYMIYSNTYYFDGRNPLFDIEGETGSTTTNASVNKKYAYTITNSAGLGYGLQIRAGNGSVAGSAYDLIDISDFKGNSMFRVNGLDGKTYARAIKVTLSNFPDYVFDASYKLMPLVDVEKFIKLNKHLPQIPSAQEIEKDGGDLGELVRLQMQKIEELTLYVIELNKQIEALKANK